MRKWRIDSAIVISGFLLYLLYCGCITQCKVLYLELGLVDSSHCRDRPVSDGILLVQIALGWFGLGWVGCGGEGQCMIDGSRLSGVWAPVKDGEWRS